MGIGSVGTNSGAVTAGRQKVERKVGLKRRPVVHGGQVPVPTVSPGEYELIRKLSAQHAQFVPGSRQATQQFHKLRFTESGAGVAAEHLERAFVHDIVKGIHHGTN